MAVDDIKIRKGEKCGISPEMADPRYEGKLLMFLVNSGGCTTVVFKMIELELLFSRQGRQYCRQEFCQIRGQYLFSSSAQPRPAEVDLMY